MARPNRSRERREQLRPVVARAFAELGYRRATTAELARRCGLQETQLFRLWPDKKAMFLDAIDHLYTSAEAAWRQVAADDAGDASDAERILAMEAGSHGASGLYRIVFAGLSETTDPQVRAALRSMFRRFHALIAAKIEDHRGRGGAAREPGAGHAAWAIIGVALASDVLRELRIEPVHARAELWRNAAGTLLDGH